MKRTIYSSFYHTFLPWFCFSFFALSAFLSVNAQGAECQDVLQTVRGELVILRELSQNQTNELENSLKTLKKLQKDNSVLQTDLMHLSASLTAAQTELAKEKHSKRTALVVGLTVGAAITIGLTGGLIYLSSQRRFP